MEQNLINIGLPPKVDHVRNGPMLLWHFGWWHASLPLMNKRELHTGFAELTAMIIHINLYEKLFQTFQLEGRREMTHLQKELKIFIPQKHRAFYGPYMQSMIETPPEGIERWNGLKTLLHSLDLPEEQDQCWERWDCTMSCYSYRHQPSKECRQQGGSSSLGITCNRGSRLHKHRVCSGSDVRLITQS